jgi:hypothetical protein
MPIVSVPKNVWTSVVTASADTVIENLGHSNVFISTTINPPRPKKLTITTITSGNTVYVYSVNKDTEINYFTVSESVGVSDGDKGDITVSDSGTTWELNGSFLEDTFESVSKNLKSINSTLNYSSDRLTSIVYANGVTKTLNYSGDTLTTVVLSGSTPGGISLTKTFTYSGDTLTGVAYS